MEVAPNKKDIREYLVIRNNMSSLAFRGRTIIRKRANVVRAHNSEIRHRLSRAYNEPAMSPAEVEKWMFQKFKRVVDFDFVVVDKSLALKVSYCHPRNPQLYCHKITYLTETLNLWSGGLMFKNVLDDSGYPDFFLDPATMELHDLPVILRLDIPSNYEFTE